MNRFMKSHPELKEILAKALKRKKVKNVARVGSVAGMEHQQKLLENYWVDVNNAYKLTKS